MISSDEHHIPTPSSLSDSLTKKEYGRELAFNSLMKASFKANEISRTTKQNTVHSTELPRIVIPTTKPINLPQQTKRRGVRKRSIFALAASIVAITAPLWLPIVTNTNRSDQLLTITGVEGKANIDSQTTPANEGATILAGGQIKTGKESSIKLSYPDGTILQLASTSELTSLSNSNGNNAKNLYLKNGQVKVWAQKQPPGKPMTVTTRFARAEVIGTVFSLKISDEHTELIVNEGIVNLIKTDNAEKISVKAGYVARVGPNLQTLHTLKPEITNFSLIAIKTGQPIPGFEKISGAVVIPKDKLPREGIGIQANVAGLSDMIEMNHPENSLLLNDKKYPLSINASDDYSYRAINENINPYTITATPYSRTEGKGKSKKLTLHFSN